jgi:hypothetical protein
LRAVPVFATAVASRDGFPAPVMGRGAANTGRRMDGALGFSEAAEAAAGAGEGPETVAGGWRSRRGHRRRRPWRGGCRRRSNRGEEAGRHWDDGSFRSVVVVRARGIWWIGQLPRTVLFAPNIRQRGAKFGAALK